MQELFHAGGQGVPDKVLDSAMLDVYDLVEAMGIATGLLCECMERESGRSVSVPHRQQPAACADYDSLLCILSHRADRVASKYLKDKQKMPKMDGKRKGLFF